MTRENFLQFINRTILVRKAAEIGVLNGDFSQMILDILKPETLHLIDPYGLPSDTQTKSYEGENALDTMYSTQNDYLSIQNRFNKQIRAGRVVINRSYSYEAVKKFPDYYFDFIYIDGCHLYDCVKKDLNDYHSKLKLTGLMCGHDYNMYDVKQAVDEFIKETSFKLIAVSDEFDFALQV